MTKIVKDEKVFAPGMRVEIRDAEWIVKRVEATSKVGGYALYCDGVSGFMRGRHVTFLTSLEENIRILDPKKTNLIQDKSSYFSRSKLFIESMLRKTPATDNKIHIAQYAAMDVLKYQLKPALMALDSPRPRILIADGVGIGKTLEAGILVTELIARGRGRRILVLAVKSMLSQFQAEFWNRFSIPLTCLDSEGISRIQQDIPAGQNPFHHIDRAIISIDTLKNDTQYRNYLEGARWDIIIIDEAHNVAERGTQSQRARLAKLLSTRSDALIMLSATPHDGHAESFASLILMLDPMAIVDPSNYAYEEFKDKNIFIRRYKNDIRDELDADKFPERKIEKKCITPSAREEQVFEKLTQLEFTYTDGKRKKGGFLFRTTLEKALFSSPAACLATIESRKKNLLNVKRNSEAAKQDHHKLVELAELIQKIDIKDFSKFNYLVKMLTQGSEESIGWDWKKADDRLVIFTESLKTLDFLSKNLPAKLGLKNEAIVTLRGDDKDKDLEAAIDSFNKKDSPVRLMLATDVASEGLNLHRLSHRMIHFDIPWSLMTFQQRNGRIDRYGQKKQPEITYLQTMSNQAQVFGDAHVLLRLTEKDEQTAKNIDNPREFLGSVEEQENRTAATMQGEDVFEKDDWSLEELADFFMNDENGKVELEEPLVERSSLFRDDYEFVKNALDLRNKEASEEAKQHLQVRFESDDKTQQIKLDPPSDLLARLRFLPKEVLPEDGRFILSADKNVVSEAIVNATANPFSKWPLSQLLWEMHPVVQWIEDFSLTCFGRNSAPLVRMDGWTDNEVWYLIYGGYGNHAGSIPFNEWFAVSWCRGQFEVKTLKDLFTHVGFEQKLSNNGSELDAEVVKSAKKLMGKAVDLAKETLTIRKSIFESHSNTIYETILSDLKRIKDEKSSNIQGVLALEDEGDKGIAAIRRARAEERQLQLNRVYEESVQYVKNVCTLEGKPFLQVVAVFSSPKLKQDWKQADANSVERVSLI